MQLDGLRIWMGGIKWGIVTFETAPAPRAIMSFTEHISDAAQDLGTCMCVCGVCISLFANCLKVVIELNPWNAYTNKSGFQNID